MAPRVKKEYTWHDKWGIEQNGHGFIQLVATNISQKERKRVGKLLVATLNGELIEPECSPTETQTCEDILNTPILLRDGRRLTPVELICDRPGGVASLAAEVTGKNYKKKRSK